MWPVDRMECHSRWRPDDRRCTQPNITVSHSQLIAHDVAVLPVNGIARLAVIATLGSSCLRYLVGAGILVPSKLLVLALDSTTS